MARSVTVTVTARGQTIRGTYHGGAYIDLSFGPGQPAFDVINVYDYAKGAPSIPFTDSAVARELREWLRSFARESLGHDMAAYRESVR